MPDGDNVLLGARLPGHELTAVIYIDHNLGTVVKDAFPVPGPISEVIERLREAADDPDVTVRDIGLANARARVAEAIEVGAIMFPPFETETWPASRPLTEWLLRLLPADGTGYTRPVWSEAAKKRLANRFFGSRFGKPLDDADHQDLLDQFVWFGTDYGPGDPLRWSPVAVEILLADWIPRKIVAHSGYLSKAPELLRAFIQFCHAERKIRPALTGQTLAAVDEYEPEYQRVIRSPRPQGPGCAARGDGRALTTRIRGKRSRSRSSDMSSTRWPKRSVGRMCSARLTTDRCRTRSSAGRASPLTFMIGLGRCWPAAIVAAATCSAPSPGQHAGGCWPAPCQACQARCAQQASLG